MTDVRSFSSATELLRGHVASTPQSEALVWVRDLELGVREKFTYAEADERARAIAAWLSERCAPGARVLLLYPPVEFIVGFLGCLYAGVVAVPAPLPGRYPHERRRVRAIAADAGVSAVLTAKSTADGVAAWVAEELGDVAVLATDGELPSATDWSMPDLTPDTLALLQYTSGSTATPKGVMVTHRNLLVNASTMYQALDIKKGTRFGGWAPQYHDMGLMAQTLPALFLGSTCVLMDPTAFIKRPYAWLRMIDEDDIAWSAAPNFGYELCRRRVTDAEIARLDLSRWRHAVNGSEPVQAQTILDFGKRFASAGFRPDAASPCYGLAESTVFVSGAPVRPPVITRVGTEALERGEFVPVRFPVPGRELPSNGRAPLTDVVIAEPGTGQRLGPGRIGEIWLRGQNVAAGYWRNEEATALTFGAATTDGDAGYLRTGDLGVVHDGEIYVTGRLKELLIVNGRNIYPQDVEHELRAAHPELGNVGAAFTVPVAAPDGGADDEVLAVVHEVQGRPEPAELAALAARMKHTVARDFGVRAGAVVLVRRGAVRRTTSGKIQRTAMRELFLGDELAGLHRDVDPAVRLRPPSLAAVRDWLIDRLAERVGVSAAEIRTDALMAEYGLDSVHAVELCGDIEHRWGLVTDPAIAWDHPSVDELAAFLLAKIAR